MVVWGDMNDTNELEPRTVEPITIGGWYERVDGTVALYAWANGTFKIVQRVASWEDVAEANRERMGLR